MATLFEQAEAKLGRPLSPFESRFMLRRIIFEDAPLIVAAQQGLSDDFRHGSVVTRAVKINESIQAANEESQRAAAIILEVLTADKPED